MGPATPELQRMIGKASAPDFLNAALEGRRLFAEAWGTFLLVLVAAGGVVIAARTGSTSSSGALAIAPGVMVMVIIYTMGAVSGAHLNPAVTLAFALRRHFPWRRVPGYLLAQLSAVLRPRSFYGPCSGPQARWARRCQESASAPQEPS